MLTPAEFDHEVRHATDTTLREWTSLFLLSMRECEADPELLHLAKAFAVRLEIIAHEQGLRMDGMTPGE